MLGSGWAGVDGESRPAGGAHWELPALCLCSLPCDKKNGAPPAATAKSQLSLRRRQAPRGKSSPVLKKNPNKGLAQVTRHRLCCLPPGRAHPPTKEGRPGGRGCISCSCAGSARLLRATCPVPRTLSLGGGGWLGPEWRGGPDGRLPPQMSCHTGTLPRAGCVHRPLCVLLRVPGSRRHGAGGPFHSPAACILAHGHQDVPVVTCHKESGSGQVEIGWLGQGPQAGGISVKLEYQGCGVRHLGEGCPRHRRQCVEWPRLFQILALNGG